YTSEDISHKMKSFMRKLQHHPYAVSIFSSIPPFPIFAHRSNTKFSKISTAYDARHIPVQVSFGKLNKSYLCEHFAFYAKKKGGTVCIASKSVVEFQ
ncbi:MAG: hypothetical protein K2N78_07205, partial [Oscillospiraceae bacterium]|nr:hypothetical protein [Oscillospiraceae bacterium]